jgi:hypothetical protein
LPPQHTSNKPSPPRLVTNPNYQRYRTNQSFCNWLYGFTAPPDGTTVTPVLSAAEVEALVDYVLAKMVGK